MTHKPVGEGAMTNAEHQAHHRSHHESHNIVLRSTLHLLREAVRSGDARRIGAALAAADRALEELPPK